MKKIILLFSLITLVGCSEFSNRKDQSQNIVFQNAIPQGKYDFKIISLPYPNTYSKKISFYNEFNKNIYQLNENQKNKINLLISEEMNKDFSSLLTTGWFDKEVIGMKVVEDLNSQEIEYLNTLNIPTPTNAGNLQELLNKQYYLLLHLTNNSEMYNPEFLYTELDKSLLMEEVLLDRKTLIENLNKLKKNFVYESSIKQNNSPIYITNPNFNVNNFSENPVLFLKSNTDSGFEVLSKNLIIFVGNGKELHSNEDYQFLSNIVALNSLDEIKSASKDSSQVSSLLTWKRKQWKTKISHESLENQFSTWEDK
jgi:hypothetical protein